MTTFTKWSLVAITLVSSASSTPLSTSPHHSPSYNSPLALAPLFVSDHPHSTINNSYIIKLKSDLPLSLKTNHLNYLDLVHEQNPLHGKDSGLRHVYDSHVFTGYSGHFSEQSIQQLRAMPEVEYIEKDQIVSTMDVQKSAPWGLARISHRPRLGFGNFNKYEYKPSGGQGVDVYVIDTGINIHHEQFDGRASWGKTIPQDVDEDGNGHGTHCAGTIASRKYGVAKEAHVIAVKVLGSNGSGSMSDVVAGVAWASTHARAKAEAAEAAIQAGNKTQHVGSVANMSLGGGKSNALNDAVNSAVANGLHFAVAAGNDNRDACLFSPAGAEKAVTVGASTLGDERAYFSNHGSCVDVFGPGLNILSTYIGPSNNEVATLSGTSMASPHTAGLLAYLLSMYPSETFNPVFNEQDKLISLTAPQQAFTLSPTIYTLARAVLPLWVSSFLPLSSVEMTAPVPPKRLSTYQMKEALIALSSEGLLTDLPPHTVNKLIFNNATTH